MATYTSSLDPHFYERKLQNFGALGQAFLDRRDQQEEEGRQRAMGRLKIATEAVAAGGSPNDPAVEAAIKELEKYDAGTAAAMRSYIKAIGAPKPQDPRQAAYEQMVKLAQEAKNKAMTPPGMGVLKPDVYQQQVQQAAGAPMSQYIDQARQQMPFGEQLAAGAYAEKEKIPLPEAFDPGKLSAGTRDLMAMQEGRLPEEVAKGVRMKAGFELTEPQKAMEKYRAATDSRQRQMMVIRREREARLTTQQTQRHSRLMTRLDRDLEESLAEVITKTNLEERKDWKEGVDLGAIDPEKNPRPPALLLTQNKKIAGRLVEEVKAGKLTEEEAFDLSADIYELVKQQMAAGASAAQAVDEVLKGIQ